MSEDKGKAEAPPPIPVQECLLDPRWDFLWINLDGHMVRVLRLNLPNGLRFDSMISETAAQAISAFMTGQAPKFTSESQA